MKEISFDKIREIINSNMEDVEISEEMMNEDLTQVGMDSITFIKIIVTLEEEFECEVPDSKLLISEMNTVNKMIRILKDIETNN